MEVININILIYLQLYFAAFFFISLFILFAFSRKSLPKINAAFKLLEDKGYLNPGDYGFYENLGIWGLGFRVSILNVILKGKVFKIKDGRMLKYCAREAIINSAIDFSWMKGYFIILYMSLSSFFITVILAFLLKSSGL